jgi:hypothetical protein
MSSQPFHKTFFKKRFLEFFGDKNVLPAVSQNVFQKTFLEFFGDKNVLPAVSPYRGGGAESDNKPSFIMHSS